MIFTWVGANKGNILAKDEKGGSLETQTIKTTDFCVSYKIFVLSCITFYNDKSFLKSIDTFCGKRALLMNFSTKTTTRKKSSISTKPVDISFR